MRLADAASPYLQQHKDNPVDWWPWSDAAFDEAKRRDVPIFLSIGYATCHWCHVMAHESFEDEEVAAVLNANFVCIKVDREERPDVDDTYMQACLAANGSGGWPLTVALDHERRPWFVGTYFPKTSRPGRIGLLDLVPRLTEAWTEKRDELHASANHLMQHLGRLPDGGEAFPPDAPDEAVKQLLAQEAPNGGFGRAPMFPSLHNVRLLLRHPEGIDAACRQLHAMARGGIRDHVGGGFHRYSTDDRWHLPHFEKMLYDQAMALLVYSEAMMVRPDPAFEEVIRDTAQYLQRDMLEAGAFHAAEDADAEGEEGLFTTWPHDELASITGTGLASQLGSRPEGNFHDESTREPVDRNILWLTPEVDHDAWRAGRGKLLDHRAMRVAPFRDDKILADWNGLAAAGLACAGRALSDDSLLEQARACLQGAGRAVGAFDGTWHPQNVKHMARGGHIAEHCFAEDLAGFAFGAAHLALATGMEDAVLAERFLDALSAYEDGGIYRRTPEGGADLHDGAIPSANTLIAEADLIVARVLAKQPTRADAILARLGKTVRQRTLAFTGLLSVATDRFSAHAEVVIVGNAQMQLPPALDVTCIHAQPDDPLLETYRPFLPKKSRAYLCRGEACEAAPSTGSELEAALARFRAGSAAPVP